MYADVIVLTYQAPDINYFTYKVPSDLEKEIKVGQLVEVPFGKRNPAGIVISCHPERSAQNNKKVVIKPLSKILINQPILLPYQIELVKWMSSYYLAPIVNCLEAMLPFPHQQSKVRPLSFPRPGLVANGSDLKQNQSLILAPTINQIPQTLAKFPKAKNYVVYHNELKASEKFAAWQKIMSGDIDYIFGSRSAIFTPCPNLKEIIIYDEHDGVYKDERSPYFDTLTVAQKISELIHTQIKIVDPSPHITTYYSLKNRIKIQKFNQEAEIIDMQKERLSGNKSAISFDLEMFIGEILESQGNIFLFLNKKKDSGHIFCKACKSSLYLDKQPSSCPNCQSSDIFWNVLNVNSLAQEIKKMFPKAQVNLASVDSQLQTTAYQLPTIDIGTAFALYAPLAQKYDLVAHIQTDSLINLADFTSAEKLFAQVTRLKKLLKDDGKLILQTYSPGNNLISFAAMSDYKSFFSQEITQRELLSYPPFSLLAKLTLKGENEEKISKEAKTLFSDLKSTIQNPITQLLGPYKSVFVQKIPRSHIICKIRLTSYALESRQKASLDIKKLIGNLPKGWQIEMEPESIQ